MTKQKGEKEFYKILDKISNKRYSAMDAAVALFDDLVASSPKTDVPEYIWSAIGLELYLCGRTETAINAMLLAVKEGEQLEGEDRSQLSPIYGDLAMMYEEDKNYTAAYDAMKKSYDIRKEFKGEDDIFTRMTADDLLRLAKFKEFTPNATLEKEFSETFGKNSKPQPEKQSNESHPTL